MLKYVILLPSIQENELKIVELIVQLCFFFVCSFDSQTIAQTSGKRLCQQLTFDWIHIFFCLVISFFAIGSSICLVHLECCTFSITIFNPPKKISNKNIYTHRYIMTMYGSYNDHIDCNNALAKHCFILGQ